MITVDLGDDVYDRIAEKTSVSKRSNERLERCKHSITVHLNVLIHVDRKHAETSLYLATRVFLGRGSLVTDTHRPPGG